MPAKRLLLTAGINDYPGTGADLSGCVNDSHDVVAALSVRGYSPTQLLDAQATKAAMLGTLEGMVRQLRWGDRLVFHYSGHGTNVADQDGDEADGRDEALVAYDYRAGGLITDDELHAVLRLKSTGSRILLLMDSCHSGSVQRFVGMTPTEVRSRPRFLDVDLALGRTTVPAPTLPPQHSRSISGVNMISGCADPEFSYDASFGGRPNGAFTYYALRALNANPGTLNAWYKMIRAALPTDRYPQTPQLQVATPWQRYSAAL